MDFHGAFSLINEKEEAKYIIWEFIYELWIIYEFYKENTKISEFNSFYWVQWLILGWSSLSNRFMNEIWEVERVVTQIKLLQFVLFWTKTHLSLPQTFITYSLQHISNAFIKPISCTCCYLELSYTSASLKPVSVTYFRKDRNHYLNCHH